MKPCILIIKYRIWKRGYAEFPNIPQLIAKNTLPFGHIMYENLSDLIQSRTRSSRCTSSLKKVFTTEEEFAFKCNFVVAPYDSCLAPIYLV